MLKLVSSGSYLYTSISKVRKGFLNLGLIPFWNYKLDWNY